MGAPLTPSTLESRDPAAGLPLSWVSKIFRELHGRFGSAFLDKFSTGSAGSGFDDGIENAKAVWARRLSGLSPEEIRRGLEAVYDYPPSCDKFIQAARPSVLETPEEAFYVAGECWVRRHARQPERWPSNRHFWAAQRMGFDMGRPYRDVEPRWATAWREAQADAGREIPPCTSPEQSLPAPGRSSRTVEQASAACEAAREALGKSFSSRPPGIDLSWTDRANERPGSVHWAGCKMAMEVRERHGLPVSDALRARVTGHRG